MRRFDLVLPNSLEDCLKILAEHGGRAKLLAGGTDLLPQMKNGVLHPALVVDLSGIARVRQVQNGNGLRIGAAVTARELELSPAVRGPYLSIAESAAMVGSLQVRNLATVGGNLCNAAPSADMAPPLVALEAQAVIADRAASGACRWPTSSPGCARRCSRRTSCWSSWSSRRRAPTAAASTCGTRRAASSILR